MLKQVSHTVIISSTLIETAAMYDRVDMFDYLVELGASTDHIDFYECMCNGAINVAIRVRPHTINIHRIIDNLVIYGNLKIADVIEHIPMTQDDFNYGLVQCVEYLGMSLPTNDFLQYANNYNVELYKKYGVIVIMWVMLFFTPWLIISQI